jgi:hypothetical protein
MAINNQLLAGTACVVVICLVFAVTSKKEDLIASPDEGPTVADVADQMVRLQEQHTYWTENEFVMSRVGVQDYLTTVEKSHTDAFAIFEAFVGDCEQARSDFEAEYAILKAEIQARLNTVPPGPPNVQETVEVPVRLGDVKRTNLPLTNTFDSAPPIPTEPGLANTPSFQTTPADLDNAVDDFAGKEDSVATTNTRIEGAFTQSKDELGRPENSASDPLGGKRSAEEVESGVGVPSTPQIEKLTPDSVPEAVNAGPRMAAPTFQAVTETAPAITETPTVDLTQDVEDDETAADRNVLMDEDVDDLTQDALFNSTGDVQFGSETIQSQLEAQRQAILNTSDLSEQTELIDTLQRMEQSLKRRDDVPPKEWEIVQKSQRAMSHIYKYNKSKSTKSVRRVASYYKQVVEFVNTLDKLGASPEGFSLKVVTLDREIARRINERLGGTKRSRATDFEKVGLRKRPTDVAPPAPKRPKTESVVENIEKERAPVTGEPAKKRSRLPDNPQLL